MLNTTQLRNGEGVQIFIETHTMGREERKKPGQQAKGPQFPLSAFLVEVCSVPLFNCSVYNIQAAKNPHARARCDDCCRRGEMLFHRRHRASTAQPARPPWPPEVSDLGFGVRLSFIHALMQATHVSPIPPGQKSGAQVVTCQCHDCTLDKSPMAVTSRTPLPIPLSLSSVTFDSETFQDLGRHTRITRGGRTYQDLSRMNG